MVLFTFATYNFSSRSNSTLTQTWGFYFLTFLHLRFVLFDRLESLQVQKESSKGSIARAIVINNGLALSLEMFLKPKFA